MDNLVKNSLNRLHAAISAVAEGPLLRPTSSWGGPWTVGVGILSAITLYLLCMRKDPYDGIPVAGNTGWITSYRDVLVFQKKARDNVMEGYRKYKPGIFRIRAINGWRVIVTSQKHAEELRLAPENVLSNTEAMKEEVSSRYLLDVFDPFKSKGKDIIKSELARNIGPLFDGLLEEIELAMSNNIKVTDDWTPIRILPSMVRVLSQSENRLFVGLPLCRNPEFIKLNIEFTLHFMTLGKQIRKAPFFLKPLIHFWYKKDVENDKKIGIRLLGPIVDERKRDMAKYGTDYPGKPNDVVSWILDKEVGEEEGAKAPNVAIGILMLNMAAIYTSSITSTYVLLDLVSRPEYIAPLREEVEAVIAEEGWSKHALGRMGKLDSFIKESQRLHGIAASTLQRKTLVDFTFSDGTRIPKGTMLSAATEGIHQDDAYYENPTTFDGLRFYKQDTENVTDSKHVTAMTSTTFLPFGHGSQSCPGRVFAINELKCIVAHLLLNYDLKAAEGPAGRPTNIMMWAGLYSSPNPASTIMMKRRS